MKTIYIRFALCLLAAVGLVLLSSAPSLAFSIDVGNNSFESDFVVDGSWQYGATSWTASSWYGLAGVWDPPVVNPPISPLDGEQVAFVNTGYLYQDIATVTFQEGLIYTLKVWVGRRWDINPWETVFVALQSNDSGTISTRKSTLVANPGLANWTEVILTYTATSEDAGKGIRILLRNNFTQANFDLVTLNAVPLPPGILLLGTGLIGLGAVGWRRKRR